MPEEIETLTPLDEILTPEGPYYELLLMDDQHPQGITGHVCNQCGREVDTEPCPEHAPVEVPGLTLIGCDATPRHWLWTHAGDFYDGPCYQCESAEFWQREEERRKAPHRRRRHWYRRTGWWEWLLRVAGRVGLLNGRWAQTCPGGGWCTGGYWRWSR